MHEKRPPCGHSVSVRSRPEAGLSLHVYLMVARNVRIRGARDVEHDDTAFRHALAIKIGELPNAPHLFSRQAFECAFHYQHWGTHQQTAHKYGQPALEIIEVGNGPGTEGFRPIACNATHFERAVNPLLRVSFSEPSVIHGGQHDVLGY